MEISTPNPLHFDMVVDLVISKVENWKDLLSCRLVNVRWNQLATRRINKEKCCNLVLCADNFDQFIELQNSQSVEHGKDGKEKERANGVVSRLKVLKLQITLPRTQSPPTSPTPTNTTDNGNGEPPSPMTMQLLINVQASNRNFYLYNDTSMFARALELIQRPDNQFEFISVKVLDPSNSASILVSKEFEEAMYTFLEICSPTLRFVHLLFRVQPNRLFYQHPTTLELPELKILFCHINGFGRFGAQGRLVISSAPNLRRLTLLANQDWFEGGRMVSGVGAMLDAMDTCTLAGIQRLSICASRDATLEILSRKQFPALEILKLRRLTQTDHFGGVGPLAEFLRSASSLTTLQIGIYIKGHTPQEDQELIPRAQPIPFINLPVLRNIKHFLIKNSDTVGKEVDDQRVGFEHGRRLLGNLVAARNAFPKVEGIGLSSVGCYQLARMFILSDRVLPIPSEYLTQLDFQNVSTIELTISDSFCLARTQSSVSHLLGKFFPNIQALVIGIDFHSERREGKRKWHAAGQKIVRFYLNHFQGIQFLEIKNYFQHFLAKITKEEPNPIKDLRHLTLKLPPGLKKSQILLRPRPFSKLYKCSYRYIINEHGQLKKRRTRVKRKSTDKLPRPPTFKAEMSKLQRSNPKLKIKIH